MHQHIAARFRFEGFHRESFWVLLGSGISSAMNLASCRITATMRIDWSTRIVGSHRDHRATTFSFVVVVLDVELDARHARRGPGASRFVFTLAQVQFAECRAAADAVTLCRRARSRLT